MGIAQTLLKTITRPLFWGVLTLNFQTFCYATAQNDANIRATLLVPKLNIEQSWQDSAKVNQNGTNLGVQQQKLSVTNFILTGSYEQFQFNWHQLENLPLALKNKTTPKSLTKLHQAKLSLKLPYQWTEDSLLLGNLQLTSAFEDGVNDSLSTQAFVILSHQLSPLGSFQLGSYVNYHPAETVILPIVEYTYNYQSNVRQGFYGHIGFPKTQIGYHFTEKFQSDLGIVYEQIFGKLSDSNQMASNGFFQMTRWRTEWANYYQLTKSTRLKIAMRMTFDNKLKTYQSTYQKTNEFTLGNSLGSGVGVQIKF